MLSNKEIKRQRALLDSAWKDYCDASRYLEALNIRIRYTKEEARNPLWMEKYYAPAEERYQATLRQILTEVLLYA